MDAGPDQRPDQHSLFDRIAQQIASQVETAAADETADATAEMARPSRERPTSVDAATASDGVDVAADDADVASEGSGGVAAVVDESPPGGVLLAGGWPAPDISTQMERPIVADRHCSRSGCAEMAAVTLSYHYATSQVWIDHLTPEREPHLYDLCGRHADRLSVMRGWHLDDRRGARRGDLIAV